MGRVAQHLENFPSHWALAARTGRFKGRIVCVHPSHPDGTLVLTEWDSNEQIREDFSAND